MIPPVSGHSPEDIDTTTPVGRMMMQVVALFAEFETAMIRERTSAELATDRAESRIAGGRKKLDAASFPLPGVHVAFSSRCV